jgi:hypothetical protein
MDEDALDLEISAFERMHDELADRYGSDWIVMSGQEVAGHFRQFEDAARFVASRYPNASALIRQVNPEPVQAPFLMIKG